jgi:hypothetical protein
MAAGWAAVLPDGNLLITVGSYRASIDAARLYESDSDDWKHFHVIHPSGGLPHGYLLTLTTDSQDAILWLDGAKPVAATPTATSGRLSAMAATATDVAASATTSPATSVESDAMAATATDVGNPG